MGWHCYVLGASSTITPEGDATASLALEGEGELVVVDPGGDVPGRLREVGLDYRDLTALIVTHSHPDHTYGLPFLSHSFYHTRRSVSCWSTSEAIPRLRGSLDAYDLQDEDRYLQVSFETISSESADRIPLGDELEVETLPTQHSRPGFGLKLSTNRQCLVVSGDTVPTEVLQRRGSGADVLLHDCQGTDAYRRYFEGSHTSAAQLGRLAESMNVNTLVPFHHNLTELPGRWNDITSEIRTFYSGPLLFPRKGLIFTL